MRNRLDIFLGLISLGFCGVIFCELSGSARLPVLENLPTPQKTTPSVLRKDNANLASTALERPIFEASRRPPVLPAAQTTSTLPRLRLAGVILASEERRAIIVVDGGKAFVVSRGERIGRSIVRLIAADKVFVEGPTGAQTLVLSYRSLGGTTEEKFDFSNKRISASIDPGYIKTSGTSLALVSSGTRITESGTIVSDELTSTENLERAMSRFGSTGKPFR